MIDKALVIVGGILGVACVVLYLLWDNASAKRALAEASLNTALEANASLVGEAKRAKADAAAEAERAMQRQRERDGLAEQVIEMRRVLGDDPCSWTAEKARALDKFLGAQ